MVRLFISLIATLATTAVAWAEPLNLQQLPAGAAWVIHVDFDAARSSIVGKQLRDLWLMQPDGAKAARRARDIFGFDLTRDLNSVTLYGTSFVPEHGVVIIRGKLDQPRLIAVLSNAPGSHHQTIGGHQIYFWIDADNPRNRGQSIEKTHPTAGAFFGTDVIIMGPEAQEVSSAIDVLEGKSPSLSNDSPLNAPSVPGAIVSLAATGLADAKALPIESPIVRKCQAGGIAVGEKDGQVTLRGRIATDSPKSAAGLCKIILGAKSLAEMQADDAQCAQWLNSLNVTADGKIVEVSWQYSSVELMKMAGVLLARTPATTEPFGKNP